MAAGRGERDPLQFWLSVLAALRQTAAGSALVRAVTAAPDLDGWALVERLLADLAPLVPVREVSLSAPGCSGGWGRPG